MAYQQSMGPDESGVMPESRLKIYSDLFEEVIERDRVFGSLLRKIKTAYDTLLLRGMEQEIPPMPHDGPEMGEMQPTESSWAPDPSSSGLLGRPYRGAHSNEPTRRAEDGAQGWEMHRENRVLKDLVERLHLELEEAVKREHRWKQKVAKLKARTDSAGERPVQAQAGYPGHEDHWAAALGYTKDMTQMQVPDRAQVQSEQADASKIAPGAPARMNERTFNPTRTFNAMQREPDLDVAHEGMLNQGGLLSLSSISPQTSANPGQETMECMMGGIDTARSTDSGMLPQRPTRRDVIKPAHVPMLDLSRLKQHEEEDEEEDEEQDEEGLGEEEEDADQQAGGSEEGYSPKGNEHELDGRYAIPGDHQREDFGPY